jgi:hypothetical protein
MGSDGAGDRVVGIPNHPMVDHILAPSDRRSERGMKLSVDSDVEQKKSHG